jgi:hypothetical protein
MGCPDSLGLCQATGTARQSQTAGGQSGRYRHVPLSRGGTTRSPGSPHLAVPEINRRVFFRHYELPISFLSVTNAWSTSW